VPELKLDMRIQQETVLTPRLQQSLKYLQMSVPEFQQAVQHALGTNPFLEDPDDDAGVPSHADRLPEPSASTSPQGTKTPEPVGAGNYPAPRHHNDVDPVSGAPASRSLYECLLMELGTLSLSQRDYLLANYIIDSLDEDGYMRQNLENLPEANDFRPKVAPAEWRAALHTVQQLLTPGIAARDLRECLLLQLQAPVDDSETDTVRELAAAIVGDHLERLGRNDWTGLREALQTDDHTLSQACQMIRQLDPRPGRRYDNSPVAYAIPDVIVDRDDAGWRVRLNDAAMPRACLQTRYVDYLRHATDGSRNLLRRELQEARWLIQNMEQRYATIIRVAEAILKRQHRFFEYGDVALRPLTLHELAQDIDVHESTVSRATDGKYMLTPRGLYAFRHFFSRELNTASAGTCSATAVRALIKELVDAEDGKQPLSDVALARSLADNGIVVARRTVTKYRHQLKIPSVEHRRIHY